MNVIGRLSLVAVVYGCGLATGLVLGHGVSHAPLAATAAASPAQTAVVYQDDGTIMVRVALDDGAQCFFTKGTQSTVATASHLFCLPKP